MKTLEKSINYYCIFVVATASFSGFLFGYYTAIISGALALISPSFQLTLGKESAFVSVLLLGAILGCFLGGYLTDRMGRKKVFLLTCFLWTLGCLILIMASSYPTLIVARIVHGISIGIVSVLVPLYLGEISSAVYRGRIVSIYQLMMTLGILVAYFINYKLTPTGNWKMMFLMGLWPVFLQLICLCFIPESPLWLFRKNKILLATESLKKLKLPASSFESPKQKSFKVSHKTISFLLLIGGVLGAVQQLTGINTIIYYAPRIFQHAGYSSHSDALLATILLGITNFVGSFISVWLLDYVGRRKLLLVGIFGMMMSLICLSVFSIYSTASTGWVSIAALISYMFFFSIGPGPVTWVLLSEIYPPQIRDKAMTISLITNWVCVYLVLWTFPYLLEWIEIPGTFGIYSFISLISFLFILKFIPETKQKSLEDIAEIFEERNNK